MEIVLILGNQLFDRRIFSKKNIDPKSAVFFMREDAGLGSCYKFHKHKIILYFAAMRTYREELRSHGYEVHYEEYCRSKAGQSATFESALSDYIQKHKFTRAHAFEIEDKSLETRILRIFENPKGKQKLELEFWQSPMFLTSRQQFRDYLLTTRRPFMKTFYESQRKRLNILVDEGLPVGGAWSYDSENRQALPKGKSTPELPTIKKTEIVTAVEKLVGTEFENHPGEAQDFWLPVDRAGAKSWLRTFLKERLSEFGPFEDAIPLKSEFLFHSVLTPFLNCGLLTPQEVVAETLRYNEENPIPLPSLEGFLRQVIGWREFIRGIHQNFSEKQETTNFWKHSRKLSPLWYEGNTGIPPLDETIRRVVKRGYAHHIERLMIVGSLMVLLEVEPQDAHRWFMEMFIDSAEWVMGPNVYGMALFSDGGIFATKPYICGSNYLRKMGGYPKAEWCDGVDGLYWQFIRKHESYFLKNPRLAMMARSCQKILPERWKILDPAAENLRKKLLVAL
ncbi:MAG: cryptochrome/photolyase family protein [Bdellovibrionaceae bacterium]|nr:cryptochrome/photolyase family protein [Pseudobdellovibrionaceae bacterium]